MNGREQQKSPRFMQMSLKFFRRVQVACWMPIGGVHLPSASWNFPGSPTPGGGCHHGHDMAMGGATMVIPVRWQVQDRAHWYEWCVRSPLLSRFLLGSSTISSTSTINLTHKIISSHQYYEFWLVWCSLAFCSTSLCFANMAKYHFRLPTLVSQAATTEYWRTAGESHVAGAICKCLWTSVFF